MRGHLTRFGLLAVGLVLLAPGCLTMGEGKVPRPVADALNAPDEFILYSLEPGGLGKLKDDDKVDAKTFHGHTILGQTEVKDAATRKKLVTAFNRGVGDHDGSVAGCFMPHHGIRVRSGKHVVDLVVCFMCAQVKVYENGKEGELILISTSPRDTFNEVLKQARVPLSEKAK